MPADASGADDMLDAAELFELGSLRMAMRYIVGSIDSVEPLQLTSVLQSTEEVRDRCRRRRRLEAAAHAMMKLPTFSRGCSAALRRRPTLAGLDPGDAVRSTPLSSSQVHASMPVLPAPITT